MQALSWNQLLGQSLQIYTHLPLQINAQAMRRYKILWGTYLFKKLSAFKLFDDLERWLCEITGYDRFICKSFVLTDAT